MSLLLSSVFCLAHIAGVSAVAVLNRKSLDASVMQPDVVAGTLAQVERNWRNEVVAFLECNASQPASQGRCAGPKQAFMRSCSSIMGAVVKASAGDRSQVKEYMQDVCGESVLEGFWKNNCLSFASSLDEGMTDDSYTNRVDLNLSLPCTNLFQAISVNEAKRIAKETEERAAMEKKLAEERAEVARKAAEEQAEAERRRVEAERKAAEEKAVAERKAAEERAKAERKAAEEAKKKLEEEAKKKAAEAKKKAEEAAHEAEEAKRKAAEAAAQLKKKDEQAKQNTHEAKPAKPASASDKMAPKHGGEKSPGLVKATAPALVKATTPAATPIHNATAAGKAVSKKDIVAGKAVSKTSTSKSSKK